MTRAVVAVGSNPGPRDTVAQRVLRSAGGYLQTLAAAERNVALLLSHRRSGERGEDPLPLGVLDRIANGDGVKTLRPNRAGFGSASATVTPG